MFSVNLFGNSISGFRFQYLISAYCCSLKAVQDKEKEKKQQILEVSAVFDEAKNKEAKLMLFMLTIFWKLEYECFWYLCSDILCSTFNFFAVSIKKRWQFCRRFASVPSL